MLERAAVKRAECIAKIGQVSVVEVIENREREAVSEPPERRNIQRPSAADEARSLDEVVSVLKKVQVVPYFLRLHGASSIHHDDDVSVSLAKPVRSALPLPTPSWGTIRTSGR